MPKRKKPSESANLGKKIARYAQVSGNLAGTAANMAAQKAGQQFFGMEFDRTDRAKQLREMLGNLKGPIMKVAQLLATIPEAVPAEYAAELRQLQSNAPPMGWIFVKRRMVAELGADWQSKFRDFSQTAAAAASLGQVHRATALDGTLLACKLQYPDMASVIEADLVQLKLMMQLYGMYDQSIKTDQIHTELTARLHEELDYKLEAKHINLYRDILANTTGVTIPQVYPELSSDRLLTMAWLQGKPLNDFKESSQTDRNQLAQRLFAAWYIPFYQYGVIHGDPHPGNYTVTPELGINLLDFGCVRLFPPTFVGGVIDLYNALEKNDEALAVHAFETWGFKGLTKEVIEILSIWARFLYGPLLDDNIRVIGEAKTGVYGQEIAKHVHSELRRLNAGVTVPREFVFIDRAALGLGSVFITLQAQINWHRLFNEMIADFDIKRLADAQSQALKMAGLSK